MSTRLRVLFVVNECNPEWSSVPGEGFQYYAALRKRADVTLVTHERNRQALARVVDTRDIIFIGESAAATRYYHIISQVVMRGRARWNLLNLLSYPIYAEFDARVFQRLRGGVENGAYDIVHAFTPIIPRYPYKIAAACVCTPFALGPVNGGLSYPEAFQDIARAEAGGFNRLRGLARWLPGYGATYKQADMVLCGSTATQHALQAQWQTMKTKFRLYFENGIRQEFLGTPRPASAEKMRGAEGMRGAERMRLLFVGRLVPYKGVDMLLHAVKQLDTKQPGRFQLTIVGDGEERGRLEALTRALNLIDCVRFVGWVKPGETPRYYHNADLFCFPSVREFGGAVVLEALAAGLPCLVADYGGPAEYVTAGTGFRVSIASRSQLVSELAQRIEQLAKDEPLRFQMATAAYKRAAEFTWTCKAERLVELYAETIQARKGKA